MIIKKKKNQGDQFYWFVPATVFTIYYFQILLSLDAAAAWLMLHDRAFTITKFHFRLLDTYLYSIYIILTLHWNVLKFN